MPLTPGIEPREAAPITPGRPAAALRAVIRTHYDTAAFRADVMDGLVVGLVALPLVQPQPMRVFARAGWRNRRGFLRIFRSFDRAIDRARHSAQGADRR